MWSLTKNWLVWVEFVRSKREEYIWAAGIIEGEGCFTLHTGQPYLLLDMTDKDVIESLKEVFPFGNLRGPYLHKNKENNKPRWRFDAYGKKAYAIAMIVFPFLKQRRQDKIKELIMIWRNHGV